MTSVVFCRCFLNNYFDTKIVGIKLLKFLLGRRGLRLHGMSCKFILGTPTEFFMEDLTMIDSLVYEEKSVFAGYDDNQRYAFV